ncbi:MAG TPA: hypothetical protein VMV51_08580 [Gemmatimonadaceae bacterium]|nr:hypothetical protein [Gemmatimonadaceae bacterium]
MSIGTKGRGLEKWLPLSLRRHGVGQPDRRTGWTAIDTRTAISGRFLWPSMAALVLFPPAAVCLVRLLPLFFPVFRAAVDPGADLTALIVLPGLGIGFASRYHADPSHLVDESALPYWFFVLALVGVAGSLGRTTWRSPSRRGGIFLLATSGILCSVGLTKAADTMLDRSRPTLYRSAVAKRYETTGRDGAYYLRLEPRGAGR